MRQRAPIRCEHIVPLVLVVPAKFQGDQSGQRRHVAIGMRG